MSDEYSDANIDGIENIPEQEFDDTASIIQQSLIEYVTVNAYPLVEYLTIDIVNEFLNYYVV